MCYTFPMTNKIKPLGGKLTGWQFHTIFGDVEKANELMAEQGRELIETDKVYKLSATVVEDNLGRWKPGDHMHSSIIIKYDEAIGEVETENTIYLLEGEPGDILPDLGPGINGIYY